jgi:hypothetical protein
MIYVLVPAYDEAPTVGLLLWKVRQLFTEFSREYQLIVVNDGSTDASDDVLARYERALAMTLVTHKRREGYGRSLEELLRLAVRHTDRPRRDMAVTLQADFSDPVDALPELIKRIEGGADIAIADRRRSAAASRSERWARRLLPPLTRAAVRIPGADDLVGTMRVYRLAVIERLVREAGDRPFLTREGWAADLELLVRAARHARRVESVPVQATRPEGARSSRRRHLADAWSALRTAFALRWLPAPTLPPERPEPERPRTEERKARHDRPRHERPAQAPRGRRHEHRERPGRGGRPQSEQPQRARVEQPAATDAAATPVEARQGGNRRRRRRGRGRGRGKGGTPPTGAQPSPAGDTT